MEPDLQIIPYLVISAITGFLIGLFFSQRRVARIRVQDLQKLDNKLRGYERDLDKSRGELRVQRDEINTIKSELATTKSKLKFREAELNTSQSKLVALENLETELTTKNSELYSARAELESLRSKLTHAEAMLKKPPEPDPKLLAELQIVKQSLNSKENEIATLLKRIKELAPLSLQIKDRDLRLRELETKHAQESKGREEELERLKARLRSLEADNMRVISKTAAVETQLRELESKHQEELAGKTIEYDRARARITELEAKMQALVVIQEEPEPRVQTAAGKSDM
jgi:chromosome segregation ATPase